MKNSTKIAVVMDRSASMMEMRDQAIASFNGFVTGQQLAAQEAGDASLTLTMFDYRPQILYADVPIAHVKCLNKRTYAPEGGTALLDAVGATIDRMGTILAMTPEAERPDKVIVVIITDGEENSSQEYPSLNGGYERIREKVRHQEDKYSWKFLYLGAGLGSREQGIAMGVSAQASYTYDSARMGQTYTVMNNSVLRYRNSAGGANGMAAANLTEAEVASLVDPNKP